jgi:hypothetical protein
MQPDTIEPAAARRSSLAVVLLRASGGLAAALGAQRSLRACRECRAPQEGILHLVRRNGLRGRDRREDGAPGRETQREQQVELRAAIRRGRRDALHERTVVEREAEPAAVELRVAEGRDVAAPGQEQQTQRARSRREDRVPQLRRGRLDPDASPERRVVDEVAEPRQERRLLGIGADDHASGRIDSALDLDEVVAGR